MNQVFVCVCNAAFMNTFQVETIEDTVREKLQLAQKGQSSKLEEKEKNELKKRKLLAEV